MKIEDSNYYYNQAVFWAKKHDQKIAAFVISVLPLIFSVIKRYIPKNEWLNAAADGMIDGSYALRNLFIIYLAQNRILSWPKAIVLIIASLFFEKVEKNLTAPKNPISESNPIEGQVEQVMRGTGPNSLLFIHADTEKKAIIQKISKKLKCVMINLSVDYFMDRSQVSDFIPFFFEGLRSCGKTKTPIIIFIEDLDRLFLKSKFVNVSSNNFNKLGFIRNFITEMNSRENKGKFVLIGNLRSHVPHVSREFQLQIPSKPNQSDQQRLRADRCAYFTKKAT
jgi:hypothetical protein